MPTSGTSAIVRGGAALTGSLADPRRYRDRARRRRRPDRIGLVQERGIVGGTPNLAAPLQGLAEPNMVVIAEGTRRLLGNLFERRNLGAG